LVGGRRQLLSRKDASQSPELAKVIETNIEAIEDHRREAEDARSFQDKFADAVTHFAGSVPFVYFHVVWFAAWIIANVGVLPVKAFDPYPFGMLTTIVSLEAIFLSTFVLVSQNRQAAIGDRRAELDLQINLLAEHEVTRMLTMLDAIAERLDINELPREELKELENDVKPEAVLQELDSKAEQNNHRTKKRTPR
jgi:uncharacterized membrane protein